jgi:hypothetical protein
MKKPSLNLKSRVKGAATYTKGEVERRIKDYRQERREKLKLRHSRPHPSTRARIVKVGKALPTYEALYKPPPDFDPPPKKSRSTKPIVMKPPPVKPRSVKLPPLPPTPAKVSHPDNFYGFANPLPKYGEDILNTVDEVLSIKNPRRNRK